MEPVMSDDQPATENAQPIPASNFNLEAYYEKERENTRCANELLPANKAALFGVLAAAGVTTVVVSFDGYGDSGQIEDIGAKAGDDPAEFPDEKIEILSPIWGSAETKRETHTVEEAIEHMAYAFLRQTHEGWENNDGAYGEFVFDVAERTISLDYHERYTSSEYYAHEF
jgi:hypothetical protein